MNDKEVYLSNLEWIKTHDNMGSVKGDLIFKDNISYEEYIKILEEKYFILSNIKLQSNWNSLREWLETLKDSSLYSLSFKEPLRNVLDKMNELEEKDND